MSGLRSSHVRQVVAVVAQVFIGLSIGPAFAADVTTPFAGKAVNGGNVTHEHRDGKYMLAVSADFQVAMKTN